MSISNLSKYLTEADNAPLTYPDRYKPKDVWKIREETERYYGAPDIAYLSASFVLEKNLKWPDLGFNLVVQTMNGGRTLVFLSKEDAEQFLKILKAKYPDLDKYNLIVGHGRGGDELVRINTKTSIPIYMSKRSLSWLAGLPDTKVPQEIRDRIEGDVEVAAAQKEKEEKAEINKQKTLNFKEEVIKAIASIDPNYKVQNSNNPLINVSMVVDFVKDNAKVRLEDGKYVHMLISWVEFPFEFEHSDFDALWETLVPDESVRKSLPWYDSCRISDNQNKKINYPKLTLRRNWDSERITKEINNYLDKIISTVNNFYSYEEFI